MADCQGTVVVFDGDGGGVCGHSPAGWGHCRTRRGPRHWRGQSRASLCEGKEDEEEEEEPGGGGVQGVEEMDEGVKGEH